MKQQTPRWMSRRVGLALDELGEPEVERLLVSGAVVQRQGDHYWIVSGDDAHEVARPPHPEESERS